MRKTMSTKPSRPIRTSTAPEMLTDVQDQLCQEITDQLIDLIFNATLGNW